MTRLGDPWVTAPDTRAVMAALAAGGCRSYFVGGCVRNALLGLAATDIDIATDAHPDAVMAAAKAAGLKAVPTGIDHGTVTLVAGGRGFEITTFRRDVETDGRRAVVAYSDDMTDDARRRDFTMNALYADAEGTVIDPLDGLPDLRARRVRFIEDATARIREDYLRSLRFFRFHAHYGDPNQGADPEALAAIAANLDGLAGLSKERVGAEMLKLLAAPDPAPSVANARACGVLGALLPGADDRALAPLVHLEHAHDVPPDPVRRLAALGGETPDRALRLSRAQARQLSALHGAAFGTAEGPATLGYRFGVGTATDALLLRHAVQGMPLPDGALDDLRHGAAQQFPVTAADLMPGLGGAELGARLADLETAWIASGFVMSRDQLLALPD